MLTNYNTNYMETIFNYANRSINALLAPIRIVKDKLYDAFLIQYYNHEYNSISRLYKKNIIDEYVIFISDPTEVYPNLYLGSAYNAVSYQTLINKNIKYIINVTLEISNYYIDDSTFTYYQIPIRDNNTDSILTYLLPSYEFIDNALKKNDGNILVHCFMGSSRSTSIIANYISKKEHKNINDTINDLRKKRSSVNPTIKFINELNI